MTVPVGLATLFFYPDIPHNTRAWYLNEDEIRLAVVRAENAGKALSAKLSLSKIVQIATRWSMWTTYGILNWLNSILTFKFQDGVPSFSVMW